MPNPSSAVSAHRPLSSSPAPVLSALRSFPTRRSSDLVLAVQECWGTAAENLAPKLGAGLAQSGWDTAVIAPGELTPLATDTRSEDHTSELQSRGQLVCRLLLQRNKT